MRIIKISLLLCLCPLLLSGCLIGNGMICGPQTPMAYCSRESALLEKISLPYYQRWEKPNMTLADMAQNPRLVDVLWHDGIECSKGGGWTSTPPSFTSEQIAAAKQSEDKLEFITRNRLINIWAGCMIAKGYHYTGECYDNEQSRNSVSCNDPVRQVAGYVNPRSLMTNKARIAASKIVREATPYSQMWHKPALTPSIWWDDANSCSNGKGAMAPTRSEPHFEQWQSCMVAKGYQYTGQ